jgi:UDP-N-acetylmuramyl pentapeptide phosphotransferase/UDP-N-acetylglucosamine-1-phosphate transferase
MIIPQIIRVACENKLFDIPEKRKVHTGSIPRLGGVSFFPVFLLSVIFTMGMGYIYNPQFMLEAGMLSFLSEFGFVICGLILLFLTGMKDDLLGMRYLPKFGVQFFAASLIPLSGVWIDNLYGLLGIYHLSPVLGIPLTIFIIIFVINAVNLIDGIDGLASGLSGIGLTLLGSIFLINKEWLYAMSSFTVAGLLIPFFYYNVFGKAYNANKIFMGDTGSLTLGYFLAYFSIRLSNVGETGVMNSGMIMIAFAPLLIPMLDVCRVMYVRYRAGTNLFVADRNHIHHKFVDLGYSASRTLSILLFMSVFICFINVILARIINVNLLLIIDIMSWVGLKYAGVYMTRFRRENKNGNVFVGDVRTVSGIGEQSVNL